MLVSKHISYLSNSIKVLIGILIYETEGLPALIIDLLCPIPLRGFQLNSPIKLISCQSK